MNGVLLSIKFSINFRSHGILQSEQGNNIKNIFIIIFSCFTQKSSTIKLFVFYIMNNYIGGVTFVSS